MSKYHAVKVTEDGITFDSKAEHRRYLELKLFQKSGLISNLCVHTRYPLVVNGIKLGVYECDFDYRNNATGQQVYEDVKGVKTPVYRLKKKLMLALHGIEITEVQV